MNNFNWLDMDTKDDMQLSQLLYSFHNLTDSKSYIESLSNDYFHSDFLEDGMETLKQLMDIDGGIAMNSNLEMNSSGMSQSVGTGSKMSLLDTGIVQQSGFYLNTEE